MISGGDLVWLQKTAMVNRRKKGGFIYLFFFSLQLKVVSSSWLQQMRNGTNRYSRAVWVTAIIIIILLAGGLVLGLFLRRNAPAHQQPKPLGGSADSLATSTSISQTATGSQPSSLHVSPTLTLKNREEPTPSTVPSKHLRMHAGRRFDKLDLN